MLAVLKMRLAGVSAAPSEHAPVLPLITQLRRYAITGAVSNIVLYGLYLALTGVGAPPEAAMSLLYAIGVSQTFVVNRVWSFRHAGPAPTALLRYLATYAIGYLANLAILVLFADVFGFDHRYVQAAAILLVAAMLFFMQRQWVFQSTGTADVRTV